MKTFLVFPIIRIVIKVFLVFAMIELGFNRFPFLIGIPLSYLARLYSYLQFVGKSLHFLIRKLGFAPILGR